MMPIIKEHALDFLFTYCDGAIAADLLIYQAKKEKMFQFTWNNRLYAIDANDISRQDILRRYKIS